MAARAGLIAGTTLVALAGLVAAGVAPVALYVVACAAWAFAIPRPIRPAVVFAAAALMRLAAALSPYQGDDLYRYVWEGRIQAHGFSPYRLAPDDPSLRHLREETHGCINHPEMTTIYPPLAQMLFRGAWEAGLRERGFRNLFLALDLAVVALLLGWPRARPHAHIYAWSPLAVASAAAGHLDPLMLLFLVASGWAWESGRRGAAAAALGLAILAKTMAVLLLPWMLIRTRNRQRIGLLLVVALGYLPYAGPGLFTSLAQFTTFSFNASLYRLLDSRPIAGLLLACWTLFVAWWHPRYAPAAALTFAGLLLLSPTVHLWYLTWFLVVLPAVGPRRWTWPLLLWCVTSTLAGWTYVRFYGGGPFAERFPLTWIEYALPAALALGLARRAPRAPLVAGSAALAGRAEVILPCRGEAANLRELLPAWLATPVRRVIVADTPTGDGTREIAEASPRALYLPVERRGYGAAVAAALERAEAELVVIADADHHLGPAQVENLLAPFADPSVGFVSAARRGRLPFAQRLGNALATRLVAAGWRTRFRDLGPFRALRRASWPPGLPRDPGFGWNVEMNVRALQMGIGVAEVELPCSDRLHGENRISGTLRGILAAGHGMLRQLHRLREERCTVLLLTKLPGHLPVKTRLLPLLGEEGVVAAYREMVVRTVALAKCFDSRPTIAFSPGEADPAAALPGVRDCEFLPLAGEDGAACLEEALSLAWRGLPLVVLGGDAPDLPADRIEQALAARGAAIVPTPDGGFSLLRLDRPVRGLSAAFRYGGGDALAALVAFLKSRRIRITLLEPWRDIDTPEDYLNLSR